MITKIFTWIIFVMVLVYELITKFVVIIASLAIIAVLFAYFYDLFTHTSQKQITTEGTPTP